MKKQFLHRLALLVLLEYSHVIAFHATTHRATVTTSQTLLRSKQLAYHSQERALSMVPNVEGVASTSDSSVESAAVTKFRIAIAGGGVGGLTTALCLLKAGHDVTVFEKTARFARFGGPIQFASNALSTLKAIDGINSGQYESRLFDRVLSKFTFTGTRTCGIKDGLRANGEFRMTGDRLDYLFNPNAPADWFVKFPLKACADLFGLPYTGVIDRPDLQEILIDECQKIKPNFLINGNPVTGYISLGQGNGVDVQLTAPVGDSEDATMHADLLIGSDGIWSVVRSQMYNEGGIKNPGKAMNLNPFTFFESPQIETRQGCFYSGYTVFAGETVIKTGT
jgi:zeaxanthin epoxidase